MSPRLQFHSTAEAARSSLFHSGKALGLPCTDPYRFDTEAFVDLFAERFPAQAAAAEWYLRNRPAWCSPGAMGVAKENAEVGGAGGGGGGGDIVLDRHGKWDGA